MRTFFTFLVGECKPLELFPIITFYFHSSGKQLFAIQHHSTFIILILDPETVCTVLKSIIYSILTPKPINTAGLSKEERNEERFDEDFA